MTLLAAVIFTFITILSVIILAFLEEIIKPLSFTVGAIIYFIIIVILFYILIRLDA